MSASLPAAGWTRLLAGALAHDVNNLAHGLVSAGALMGAGSPDAESAAFVEDLQARMRKLGVRLSALATAGEKEAWARLDDACSDACAEVDPSPGQALRAEPIPPGLRVRGTAAAVRTAIAALLEHAAAASPTAGTIRLAVRHAPVLSPDDGADPIAARGSVSVQIASPEASGLLDSGMARLDAALGTTLRDLRGDFSLVVAGAIADALGGAVYVGSSSKGGLVLALQLVAGPPQDDASRPG